MSNSKKGIVPLVLGKSLSKAGYPLTRKARDYMSRIPYASAIDSIMYVMLCTRPDVAYALSMTSRFQSDPGESHWTTVKNILKYLKRTRDVFLVYRGQE